MCAFYYEELVKESCFKKKHFKMLTSYDNEEFLYPYISNDSDLCDSLMEISLKSVEVFQKPYYSEEIKGESVKVPAWRVKEKMKTVSAALVLCLNIGVDPPDVEKANQSSKVECWINQMMMTSQKALEMIGAELQKQYERWQPRARYKHCLDPTTEEVKKLCISLRKNAKDDRVLFHYNGHGVPRPTTNGEIWVFNREFTQYIPLSLYEVQTWMGTPSLYVWDCSHAGIVIQNFLQFENDREVELAQRNELNNGNISSKIKDSIHLAACSASESLPLHPSLPVDLFTACLTTPIKAALHWYVSQRNLCQLVPGLTIELLDKIPGQINDRRTMMGELNWIFTAATDTIAWNVLDTELFQKLFRQDLLVASLFRNFLLAERIMKSLDCNPISSPALPATNEHPLWQSWDLACDLCISQLPHVLNEKNPKEFVSCGFFSEQIEIFDLWLKYNVNSRSPPEQLPVVLQVLLSQQHRLKALELLCKFLDFGPWAVYAALSVGIFPYVLKLLTTQPRELRPLLTFIWAKILAVDKSCTSELLKDNGHIYFINVLSDPEVDSTLKVYSAFVLSCIVDGSRSGQESAKQNHLITHCGYLISDKENKDYKDPLLRQWCSICLGLCWKNYADAKWESARNNVYSALIELISDPVPEVRAAAIFALATSIECGKGSEGSEEQTNKLDSDIINAIIKEYDSVYIVRKEIIIAMYNFMIEFESQFINLASQDDTDHSDIGHIKTSNVRSPTISISYTGNSSKEDSPLLPSSISNSSNILPTKQNSLITKVWRLIIELQRDPHPGVAKLAEKVVTSFILHANENKKNIQNTSYKASKSSKTFNKSQLMNRSQKMSENEVNLKRDPTISTEYIAWCSSFFLKPILTDQNKQRDLYKAEFLDQQCRMLYNHRIRKRNIIEWKEPQLMDETITLRHGTLPLHCKFHPFDDLLFVADRDCNINIYDTTKSALKFKFSNITSRRVAKITSLKLISPHYDPLVLTGTDDYVVRLFKPDLIANKRDPFITGFVAFNKTEKVTSSIEAGLVADWEDDNNNLICAGDFRCIRIWDMAKELHRDYSTEVSSCVTSLTSHSTFSIAGFGDGVVKLFDFRRPPTSMNPNPVKYEHKAMVIKVYLQKDTNKLITASLAGDVNIIDIRTFKSLNKIPTNPEAATCIECHPFNELIAIANSNQTIKIYDFKSRELATIKHHEGFLGKRISFVSCLDWNYDKNELVFGSQDNYLSVFTSRDSQILSNINS